MPARTRIRAKKNPEAETEVEEFSPMETAQSISTGGERISPEDDDNNEEDVTHVEEYDEEDVRGESGDDPEEAYRDALGEADEDPSAGTQLGKTTAGMTQGQQAAQAELNDYIRRFSNLHREKAEVQADITELKKEIKGKGYDMKAFDVVFKLLELDEKQKAKRIEQNGVNATYAHAVGIDPDLL